MKVQTNWRPGTDLIDIWISQDTPRGRAQLLLAGEDIWQWRELEEGQKVTPTLTLPGQVFQALIAEGSDILPPSAATERHLKDVIEVRNRLLDKVVPPR